MDFRQTKGACFLRTCAPLMYLAAILAVPGVARAAGKEVKERAAKTACMSGEYAKGVALLAELFVSTREVIYIFNQGRCFEQNGMYEEAIVRFREYQRKNADAGRAPDPVAEKHIVDCQELLDRRKPAAPISAPPETKPAIPAAPPALLPAAPPTPEPAPAFEPDLLGQADAPAAEPVVEGRPFYKTWWFWTSVGAVVAAGTATAFLLTRRSPDACGGLDMTCVGVVGKP